MYKYEYNIIMKQYFPCNCIVYLLLWVRIQFSFRVIIDFFFYLYQ